MSWQPCPDPVPGDADSVDKIDSIIVPRIRDIGGFEVGRVLPAAGHGMVGPFIFFDQMGPAEFLLHEGIDVRPHPHINLATVTYLRSEEHTSELQSRGHLVCRLLLEKKNNNGVSSVTIELDIAG